MLRECTRWWIYGGKNFRRTWRERLQRSIHKGGAEGLAASLQCYTKLLAGLTPSMHKQQGHAIS